MRVYRIKTSDFKNLIKVDLLDKDKKSQVETIESKYNVQVDKALVKATQVALCITSDKKYIITCKPCYVSSLLSILESVSIDASDIIIDKKDYKNTQEISIDELKAILQD